MKLRSCRTVRYSLACIGYRCTFSKLSSSLSYCIVLFRTVSFLFDYPSGAVGCPCRLQRGVISASLSDPVRPRRISDHARPSVVTTSRRFLSRLAHTGYFCMHKFCARIDARNAPLEFSFVDEKRKTELLTRNILSCDFFFIHTQLVSYINVLKLF